MSPILRFIGYVNRSYSEQTDEEAINEYYKSIHTFPDSGDVVIVNDINKLYLYQVGHRWIKIEANEEAEKEKIWNTQDIRKEVI